MQNSKNFIKLALALVVIGLIWGVFRFVNNWQKTNDSLTAPIPTEVAEHIESKSGLIIVSEPAPLSVIDSPLLVRGEARGGWYFEATFPILLVDWDGRIIAESYASAVLDPNDTESTWMTEDFVPFEGSLEFTDPSWDADFSRRGALILQKSNPSGLSEHADALEIPILFKGGEAAAGIAEP